jgi:hypothetical protein
MKCHNVRERLLRKAGKSICRVKVAALGIDRAGRIIGCVNNQPRISRKGGGIHAEQRLMFTSPKSLTTIIIARVSDSGNVRPIHPCVKCAAEAKRRGISILSLEC